MFCISQSKLSEMYASKISQAYVSRGNRNSRSTALLDKSGSSSADETREFIHQETFHGLRCAKNWRPNLGIRHQMALPVIMQEAAQVANRSATPPSKSELTKNITKPVTTSEWFDHLHKQ